jgi:hypothetical protein
MKDLDRMMNNEELVDEFDSLASGVYHDMGSLPHEREEYKAIQAELLRRLNASAWEPVGEGTMPPEGVPVLAATSEGDIITAKRVFEDGWHWEQLDFAGFFNDPTNYAWSDDYEYTHWMPLPAPPTKESE